MELGGEPDAVEPDGTREKSKNHSYDMFLGSQLSKGVPDEVNLDFDATHIPSHGDQDEEVLSRILRPLPPSGPPPWRLLAVRSPSSVEY